MFRSNQKGGLQRHIDGRQYAFFPSIFRYSLIKVLISDKKRLLCDHCEQTFSDPSARIKHKSRFHHAAGGSTEASAPSQISSTSPLAGGSSTPAYRSGDAPQASSCEFPVFHHALDVQLTAEPWSTAKQSS
jgi:hypothetical protein